MLELEDGRADRLEEEREGPEDDERLPNVGVARDDEEDDGPIRLLRLDDVAPTVGERLLGVERWLREPPNPP